MYIRRVSWLVAVLLVASAVNEAAGQVVRVSVATDGTEANSNSVLPAMSGTGRYVAFMSFASNLVPDDTNGVEDVFLRDRDTDADGIFDEAGAVSTVRVSQRPGVQANGPSNEPAITPDGRYVVFTSFASNLFATGLPALTVSVVLRWDRTTGDIVLVSQTTDNQPLVAVRSVDPDVSDDGNQVVFVYGGSLPAEQDAGFRGVVYRRDIAAGTLTQISNDLPPLLFPFTQRAVSPSIAGDGSVIAFGVEASTTSGGKQYGVMFVVDAATTAVRFVRGGVQPRLSRDGAFIAFIDARGENSGGAAVRFHLASGDRRSTGFFGINSPRVSLSPSGRYYKVENQLADFTFGAQMSTAGQEAAFDAADTLMVYTQENFVPMRPVLDVLVASLATLLDGDGDGLNDHWEGLMGLDNASGAGANGASGDPDGDGITNAEEFARGSHPRGTAARYLAEGASGTFFATRYAIANPNAGGVSIALRLELAGGGSVSRTATIAPGRTVTFDSRSLGLGTASFSAVVESNVPVVVDRLMMWDGGAQPYGSHAETSSAAPSTSWLLAEGSTVLEFQLFYLLQNPQATPTTATVRFLLPSGAPVVRTYELPARSRTTIYVNTVPGLESTDVSAEITATQPIAVERAMYRSAEGQPFALGHAAAAVTAPSPNWFFGEGATGGFFDTYLLLANPSAQPAVVQVEYLRDNEGAVTRTYTVPANRRFSVYVDDEPGMAATAFGTRVTSSVPIVAERAMYWAGGFFDYYEGHVSSGATQTGSRWVLAGAEQVGPRVAYTFVLIANTGNAPVTVSVSTLPETGPSAVSGNIVIPAHSRLTYPLEAGVEFRGGVEVREVVEQGGTLTGALVVEAALYWNAGGRLFGAGANWPATLFP
jgi:hypothetical protein